MWTQSEEVKETQYHPTYERALCKRRKNFVTGRNFGPDSLAICSCSPTILWLTTAPIILSLLPERHVPSTPEDTFFHPNKTSIGLFFQTFDKHQRMTFALWPRWQAPFPQLNVRVTVRNLGRYFSKQTPRFCQRCRTTQREHSSGKLIGQQVLCPW